MRKKSAKRKQRKFVWENMGPQHNKAFFWGGLLHAQMSHLTRYEDVSRKEKESKKVTLKKTSMLMIQTHRIYDIYVWNIHLRLVDFYGKCRQIYHTWILWETLLLTCFPRNDGSRGGSLPNAEKTEWSVLV